MILFSIYSDASISISGSVRTSWIIKIDTEIVSKGSETSPHHLPSGHSTAAELYGVYIAINKLKSFLSERPRYRFLLEFHFYLDSQSAVIGLNNHKCRHTNYKEIFTAIDKAIESIPGEVSFLWIKRNKNSEADKLARQTTTARVSYSQIVRNPTPLVRSKVISGISSIRINTAYRNRLRDRLKRSDR